MSSQSYQQTRWSLQDLLPAIEGPEFDQVLASLEETVSELEASRDKLSADIPVEEFLRLMALVERISVA